eukprot:2147842-Pleurochrysis_carterae.AAC.1
MARRAPSCCSRGAAPRTGRASSAKSTRSLSARQSGVCAPPRWCVRRATRNTLTRGRMDACSDAAASGCDCACSGSRAATTRDVLTSEHVLQLLRAHNLSSYSYFVAHYASSANEPALCVLTRSVILAFTWRRTRRPPTRVSSSSTTTGNMNSHAVSNSRMFHGAFAHPRATFRVRMPVGMMMAKRDAWGPCSTQWKRLRVDDAHVTK